MEEGAGGYGTYMGEDGTGGGERREIRRDKKKLKASDYENMQWKNM